MSSEEMRKKIREARALGDELVRLSMRMIDAATDSTFERTPKWKAYVRECDDALEKVGIEIKAWVDGGLQGDAPVMPKCLTEFRTPRVVH